MAVYTTSFNIHTITAANTANKYKLGVGGLSLYNKPFQMEQILNLRKKKKVFGQLNFLHILPVPSIHWAQISWAQHLHNCLYSRYFFLGSPKNPQVLVVLMSLLSISCWLLCSHAIQFLPPILGWSWVFYPHYYCLLISASFSKFVSPFFFCLSHRYHYSSCLKEKTVLQISLF